MGRVVEAGGYGVAALAFGLLCLLLLFSAGTRTRHGRVLLAASTVSLLWAAVRAGFAGGWTPLNAAVLGTVEVARVAAWLAFVAALATAGNRARDAGGRRWTVWESAVAVGVAAAALGIFFLGSWGLHSSTAGFAMLVLPALIGMLMLEQFYRRTDPNQRWGVKHLCLGLGLVFVYDFYLFSDALLFQRLSDQLWAARGAVNAVIVPLIAISAARNPTWEINIGLSRRIVTDSIVLIAAGVYLLVMALAGYYVRLAGGTWGGVLQVGFLVGAVAVLLAGLFSATLRARVRVFIAKHFFSYKYDYREEWLRFISTLSSEDTHESLRERAIRAIAQIVASPAGQLWTRGESGHYMLTATWNQSFPGTLTEPGGSSFVEFLRRSHWIVNLLEDADTLPPEAEGMELPAWLTARSTAWLVVPLIYTDRLEGFVVLDRSMVGHRVNWEDRDLLKTAGREVAAFVALLDANEALMDARQFDAFKRLSAFVVHDLKNILGQLSLISRNAEMHRDDPAFVDDAFKTVRSAEGRLQRVLEAVSRPADEKPSSELVDVAQLLEDVARHSASLQPRPRLELGGERLLVRAPYAGLANHIEHLVKNAQEATPDDGEVVLGGRREGRFVMITVNDNGTGMEEHFVRERLFRPFSTTKGNAGMGVGVFQVRQYIESLGGTLDVWTRPGEGSEFTMRLPRAEERAVSPIELERREGGVRAAD